MAFRSLLVALGIAGLLGACFVAGYLVTENDLFPAEQMRRVSAKVARYVDGGADSQQRAEPIYTTQFLRLKSKSYKVPTERRGRGGGLTSAGNDLVLMTHEGGFFVLRDDQLIQTTIAPPPNGFDSYVADAQGKFSKLSHDFPKFRYNDVLYVHDGNGPQLLVSFTEWWPEKACYTNSISRVAIDPEVSIDSQTISSEEWERVFVAEPCLPLKDMYRALEGHMAGGRIAVNSQGTLFLGSGDYHWDGVIGPKALAQDETAHYGKIIALDIATGSFAIHSMGHRNISGLAVDDADRVWATEHGPRGGDELNLTTAGNDYGWPSATLGTQYSGLPWPLGNGDGKHMGFSTPVYAWVPSVGISAMIAVRGFDPGWDGNLLIGSLKQKTLFRVVLQDERVMVVEPIEINERIRDVHQHTDGNIVLWTDTHKLVVLSKDDQPVAWSMVEERIPSIAPEAERGRRLKEALEDCSQCHSFDPGQNLGAPSLSDIVDADIASANYAGYSAALTSLAGNWNRERLRDYLLDPDTFAPGTSMPDPGLQKETVDDVIELLETL